MTLPPLFRPFARTCTSLSGKFNPCNVVSDCSGAEVSLASCPKTWIHSWGIPAVRRSFNALVACSCVGNRLTRVVSVGFAIVVSTFQIQSIILVITVESLKRLNRSGDRTLGNRAAAHGLRLSQFAGELADTRRDIDRSDHAPILRSALPCQAADRGGPPVPRT